VNSGVNKRAFPDTYRDEWDDEEERKIATADLQTHLRRI
jgi:hypothetical protein